MTTNTLVSRLAERLFGGEIRRRVALAVRALDDARDLPAGGQAARDRDRFAYDRDDIWREALEAWRLNPLARRIVQLTTQFVVGAGVSVSSRHAPTNDFLQAWWTHRLNRMPVRVIEWCDELTRSGNLIVLLSTDAAGMSYVRALPASQVQTIVSRDNDVEQPTAIIEKPDWRSEAGSQRSDEPGLTSDLGPLTSRTWPAYDEAADRPNDDGSWPTVALHYAVNRPVAAAWGESDLAPLLKWLSRYSAWLEDRARLNRFRQTFMYVVRGLFASRAERLARQAELNANPPSPGSILVTDAQSEAWGVLHPQLDSFEASEDGLALKKMIAAGSANPLHFLAEPESATRTTAEAAGGPTFRHYEQRQNFFLWLVGDVAAAARARRAQVDPRVDSRAPIKVLGADISSRDNAELAQAAAGIIAAFEGLRDRRLIDDAELLRVAYKFAGEVVEINEMLARGNAGGER
jgi:hypothetical protein